MFEHTCMQKQRSAAQHSSSHAAFKSNMYLQRSAAQRSVCVNAPLFSKSRSLMVFVGRDPPLSPDHSVRRRRPLATEFRCLCNFSGTLITTDSDIHPCSRTFPTGTLSLSDETCVICYFAATAISLPPPNSDELVYTTTVNHWWGRSQSWSDIKFPSRCVEHTVHCQQGPITSQPNG